MGESRRLRASAIGFVFTASALAIAVSGCTTSKPTASLKSSNSKEHFSESEYGVKASPRVGTKVADARVGEQKIGKPYKVHGKWYKPKLDPEYSKVGAASWYGDAFHGRLTANGEVYDMTHLTAAHPTMPLPSYARVTNLHNGSSILVRVNDRGPYADGRIIDLSKRAAQLLDYSHAGVAKVEVDYVGPAPVEGDDEQYLMASYRAGDDDTEPASDGVMVAMNGSTPTTGSGNAGTAALDGRFGDTGSDAVLPAYGPIVPDRPDLDVAEAEPEPRSLDSIVLGYADTRVHKASDAFDAVMDTSMTPDDIRRSWKDMSGGSHDSGPAEGYIMAGSWRSSAQAEAYARRLSSLGRVELEESVGADATWYQLNLYPDREHAMDASLQAAWAAGATDALVVRD